MRAREILGEFYRKFLLRFRGDMGAMGTQKIFLVPFGNTEAVLAETGVASNLSDFRTKILQFNDERTDPQKDTELFVWMGPSSDPSSNPSFIAVSNGDATGGSSITIDGRSKKRFSPLYDLGSD